MDRLVGIQAVKPVRERSQRLPDRSEKDVPLPVGSALVDHQTGRVAARGGRPQARYRRSRGSGELGSDGGGLLLRELALRTGLFRRLSACFRDHRDPRRTRHPVVVLVAARVLGLALGYEDLKRPWEGPDRTGVGWAPGG